MATYPRHEETVRPYRLWDAKARAQVRYRYYSDLKRAHMGALIETRWAQVGTTIEVFNAHSARLLGQYTRGVNAVRFSNGSK